MRLRDCAFLLFAAALPTASPATGQTQQLFLLDRAGDIFRVDSYQTSQAMRVPVATASLPNATYRDLAVDPASGDFLVLLSTAGGPRIDRIDRATGARSLVCDLSSMVQISGLEARADGTLYLVDALQTLVLLDPVTCAQDTVLLAEPIGIHTSVASIAIDERGAVIGIGADGATHRFDPLDGSLLPVGFPYIFSGVHAVEEDAVRDEYLGLFNGELFRIETSTLVLHQILVGSANGIAGLAFSIPVDGTGLAPVCAGALNSTGAASTLELLGTTVANDDDLELRCRRLPLQTFGYFLMGPNSASLPVGQGTLCIGAPQFRYSSSVLSSGAAGTVSFAIDSTTLPTGAPAQAGDVFVFQYWHRDDIGQGPTSNFSPAEALTFR